MSRYMIMGGFVGFLIVLVSGLMMGRDLTAVLRDGMISCFILALLARFFYRRLEHSVMVVLDNEAAEQKDQPKQGDPKK